MTALMRANHSRTRVLPEISHGRLRETKALAEIPWRSASQRARGRWKSSEMMMQRETPNFSRARTMESSVRSPRASAVMAEAGTPRATRASRMSRGSL